jgi:hypothetical protein
MALMYSTDLATSGPARGGLIGGRCNPYGAETGGPKRVLGGLHGPASAATPDMDLPDNVAQGEWSCQQRAQVRCRMVCGCGHRGQVMQLCSWHDEDNWRGEMVAGRFRQVRETIRVRGHYEEIQRRQAGLCPRCAFPGDYAQLYHAVNQWQAELRGCYLRGTWNGPNAAALRQRIEDACAQFDAGRELGVIHNCALTLVAVT